MHYAAKRHLLFFKIKYLREIPPISIGDPGLLYPILINKENYSSVRYDLGVVLHYFDVNEWQSRLREQFNKLGLKIKFINVMSSDPLNVLREIRQCDAIISSSLHGCIVADAMGIPNRHQMLSMSD